MIIEKSRLIQCPLVALVALLLIAPAQAANTPIYKCFDKHLGLLYTDVPCKGGEQLDLRPGDADPAAVAGLEREREQLSLSAAQRISDERRAALQRELADRSRPIAMEQNAPDSSADYGYGYGYGYPVFAYPPKVRPRPHPRPMPEHAGIAPNPPYVVPRP